MGETMRGAFSTASKEFARCRVGEAAEPVAADDGSLNAASVTA